MGELIDGQWHKGWYAPDQKGRFQRPKTRFRSWVKKDGSTKFAPERDRYHLYISYACPWASRIAIARSMLGLGDVLPMSVVDPRMSDEGWSFGGWADADADPIHGATYLREVYVKADPHYTGRVTVPVLWDKQEKTIVNNESRELLRMLSTEFDPLVRGDVQLSPPEHREEIDRTLDAIYDPINNGVYRAGFAGSQEAYEQAVCEVFNALDHWEKVLATRRYLVGGQITEADVCLYTTLVRFDLVYYSHFKCNLRRLQSYPNLWGYVRDLYQTPAFRETTKLDHIKVHYYWSQTTVNPSRIVPMGPDLDFDAPHDRARLSN